MCDFANTFYNLDQHWFQATPKQRSPPVRTYCLKGMSWKFASGWTSRVFRQSSQWISSTTSTWSTSKKVFASITTGAVAAGGVYEAFKASGFTFNSFARSTDDESGLHAERRCRLCLGTNKSQSQAASSPGWRSLIGSSVALADSSSEASRSKLDAGEIQTAIDLAEKEAESAASKPGSAEPESTPPPTPARDTARAAELIDRIKRGEHFALSEDDLRLVFTNYDADMKRCEGLKKSCMSGMRVIHCMFLPSIGSRASGGACVWQNAWWSF